MKELWILFTTFARIGSFTFGGGYAMLPMLQKEIIDRHHWATYEELMDYYAVGQCTPGIIAINTSTFIGYKQKGTIGGIAATLGMVFPSLVIITLIASVLENVSQLSIVEHAFSGIRVAVAVLILNVIVKMFKTAVVDWVGIVIFVISLSIGLFLNISPVYTIISSALVGISIKKLSEVNKQ